MAKDIENIAKKVETSIANETPIVDWRPILAKECQVYVFGENYIAKRFDQIHYKFCNENEAIRVATDNIYALLRFKYFTEPSDEVDAKIQDIVKSFKLNLKTTLRKVSLEDNGINAHVKLLPDYCLAFRNGVYDFKHNEWLFKYTVIEMEGLCNTIYLYDDSYIILWYIDIKFEPLDIDVTSTSYEEMIELFRSLTTDDDRNYCFELMYNMSHDIFDKFSVERFKHLSEVMGYTLLQSFSQFFVMLVGSGQNGKNSLFDGCITNRLVPATVSESLDDIASDRFVTGALENRYLNVYLESSNRKDSIGYKESKPLKQITGSMNQRIEHKGIDAYPGYLNCKHLFAANDQETIKFTDTTTGFRRRINVLETWFRWDAKKSFLKKNEDYYDTTFSDDLRELKNNITNSITYIYFAMLGIAHATKKFESKFDFSANDWSIQYADVDVDLKTKIESITNNDILKYIERGPSCKSECRNLFYDTDKNRLFESEAIKQIGYGGYDNLIRMFADDEMFAAFFAENDAYISVRILQQICGDLSTPTAFTQSIKKLYSLSSLQMLAGNKPYVRCSFVNNRLKVIS